MTARHSENASLEMELPGTTEAVPAARRRVAKLAASVGARVEDVQLAVSEAVGNAVVHAFPDRCGTITITARVARGKLVVAVCDDGEGMKPNVRSPGLGLGLSLISNVADDVRLESSDSGTRMTMAFGLA